MSQSYNIAVLPGDGIGPELMEQSIKVLQAIEKKFDVKFNLKECFIGGKAI